MRSGDKEVLTAAGIECLVDEPAVGTNLQDHPCGFTTWQLVDGHKSLNSLYDSKERAKHQKVYTATQKGALAGTSACMGFLSYPPIRLPQSSPRNDRQHPKTPPINRRSKRNNPSKSSPNSPIPPPPASKLFSSLLPAASNRASPTNSNPSLLYLQALPTVSVSSYTPSTTVHITSADPLAQPAINPAYLTHPADTYLLTTAFIFCDGLMQSSRAADSHQTTCAGRGRGSAGTLRGGGSGQGAQHNILPSVQDVCTGQIVDVRLRVKGLRGCKCAMRVFFRGELADCLCSCGEGGG